MFGSVREEPQTENTPFWPRSPYGVAKVYGHWITVNYRESYDIFACSGILFNHESPLRGKEFVTRKITDAVARIKLGVQKKLKLGNLDALRDWGFAGDYVRAMWMMLNHDTPDDYVIATGVRSTPYAISPGLPSHTSAWIGRTTSRWIPSSCGRRKSTRSAAMRARPAKTLGWEPEVAFDELVQMMVDADLNRVKKEIA